MLVKKAICGAEGWTDHRFVISKMRPGLRTRRRPQDARAPDKLDTVLSNLPPHCYDFNNQLTQQLEYLQTPDDTVTVEVMWCQIRGVSHSTALDILGRTGRQNSDWVDNNDEDIYNFLTEGNRLHKAYDKYGTDENNAAFFGFGRWVL
ncbi:hypothetical protein SprV_0100148100 [Sparganum proliferum]